MRMVWAIVFAAACTGDAPTGGTACAGVLYDPCLTEHDCQNMQCIPFAMVTACTQACTAGDNTTCPKINGMTVTCNAGGLCEPPVTNKCTLRP